MICPIKFRKTIIVWFHYSNRTSQSLFSAPKWHFEAQSHSWTRSLQKIRSRLSCRGFCVFFFLLWVVKFTDRRDYDLFRKRTWLQPFQGWWKTSGPGMQKKYHLEKYHQKKYHQKSIIYQKVSSAKKSIIYQKVSSAKKVSKVSKKYLVPPPVTRPE